MAQKLKNIFLGLGLAFIAVGIIYTTYSDIWSGIGFFLAGMVFFVVSYLPIKNEEIEIIKKESKQKKSKK